MEDKGLGNVIFYVILALIGLAGSFQNKKNKKLPGKTVRDNPVPQAEPQRPQVVVQRKPQPLFAEPIDEGHYDEPMAGSFSGEGSYTESMAGSFSSEGSYDNPLARSFSSEGSIESSMAAAFASEGIRGMSEAQMKAGADTTISDSEIGDAPAYDYDSRGGDQGLTYGFDLKKAVVYSALLDRKEYTI